MTGGKSLKMAYLSQPLALCLFLCIGLSTVSLQIARSSPHDQHTPGRPLQDVSWTNEANPEREARLRDWLKRSGKLPASTASTGSGSVKSYSPTNPALSSRQGYINSQRPGQRAANQGTPLNNPRDYVKSEEEYRRILDQSMRDGASIDRGDFVDENADLSEILRLIEQRESAGGASASGSGGSDVPTDSEPDDCAICLEPLSPEGTSTLHCGHTFHTNCIKRHAAYAHNSYSCPLCRAKFSIESVL